jgi:CRP/FNR family transcriptional regulator
MPELKSEIKPGLNLAAVIGESCLFKGLPPRRISRLAEAAALKKYRAGEIIFSQGEPGLGFHLLAEGRVKVMVSSAGGREQLLNIFKTGDVFGEVAIFMGRGYPATAEALSAALTIFFPRSELRGLMAENPDLALTMIGVLARRLAHFTALFETTLKEVPARLATFILNLEDRGGGRAELGLPKAQLAALLGTSAESLSRALGRLKNAGLIREERPFIIISDRARLAAAAGGAPPETA